MSCQVKDSFLKDPWRPLSTQASHTLYLCARFIYVIFFKCLTFTSKCLCSLVLKGRTTFYPHRYSWRAHMVKAVSSTQATAIQVNAIIHSSWFQMVISCWLLLSLEMWGTDPLRDCCHHWFWCLNPLLAMSIINSRPKCTIKSAWSPVAVRAPVVSHSSYHFTLQLIEK